MLRKNELEGGAYVVAMIVAILFVLFGVFIGWVVADYVRGETNECVKVQRA